MSRSLSSTIGQVRIEDCLVEQAAANPLANIWLGVLAVCLLGTLFCTVVLLAWPIVAQMAAG